MQLRPLTFDGAEKFRDIVLAPGPTPIVIETTPASFDVMLGGLYEAKCIEADKIALKLRISHAAISRAWGGTSIRFYISEADAEAYLRLVATTATKAIRQDLKDRLYDRVDQRDEEAAR